MATSIVPEQARPRRRSSIQPGGGANVTPVPTGMAPLSATAGAGGPPAPQQSAAPISPWGAGNNLIGSQVNPADPADTAAARGMMLPALQQMQQGPQRQQLALDALNLFDEQTEAGYQQRLRGVGQQAAKFGRIGSGMTTNELTDVFTSRERDRDAVKRGLANDAAALTLSDQMDRLGAIGSVQGQMAGQDALKRNEVRGERDFQYGVGRDADQHWLQTLQTLMPLAFGGNPSGALFEGSAGTGAGAANSGAWAAKLLEEAFRRRGNQSEGGE